MKLYYKDEYIRLFQGDCLEVMDKLIEKNIKVDAIITDPPYGTTACKWDSIIDYKETWSRLENLIVNNGCICLFGTEPFSSHLRLSNEELYKYDYKWIKSKVGNFLNAKNSPMKKYEDIMCFSFGNIANGSKNMMKYYPQGLIEINKQKSNKGKSREGTTIEERPSRQNDYVQKYTNYPNNVLEFTSESGLHPTQKPVKLIEYLINTYTNKNDLILDFTCGSGTTLLAARNLKRKCIGIELEEKYCEIAKQRLEEF
jgi:site-specific DNA-methyltransferase (adenine-specific)